MHLCMRLRGKIHSQTEVWIQDLPKSSRTLHVPIQLQVADDQPSPVQVQPFLLYKSLCHPAPRRQPHKYIQSRFRFPNNYELGLWWLIKSHFLNITPSFIKVPPPTQSNSDFRNPDSGIHIKYILQWLVTGTSTCRFKPWFASLMFFLSCYSGVESGIFLTLIDRQSNHWATVSGHWQSTQSS